MNELNFVNENVGLFFAKDMYENIILINEINDVNKSVEFTCPICGNDVKPRAINSDKVSAHFYHISATEHDSESILHWWYKNKYLTAGDRFSILVDGVSHEYICKTVETEKRYSTSFGDYVPDVVITTTNNEDIFFEYNYTNKKNSDDYTEKWIELENSVVEINIKSLMSKNSKVFKPIFFDGVICCKTKSERYRVIERHIRDLEIADRMRIKYLNGFLRDCMRYNFGEISIDDLSIIIWEMNKVDLLYLPKILKKLKCNNILSDYSNHVVDKINDMLREHLEQEGLCYSNYKWLVETGYSQKWTKCRGARFNNTIYIKEYRYSQYYNYNRCDYNDVSTGFDILLINKKNIGTAIIATVENEKKREKDIKIDKLKKHIHEQEESMFRTISKYISSLKIEKYSATLYSVQHKVHPAIHDYIDIEKEIKNYKGVGRYREIKK